MTFMQAITTIFEILMVLGLFWCIFHEDRLITFERRLFANIRRRKFKVVRTDYGYTKTVKQ
ncbi:MAG: hypothetical protein U0L88_10295 [Acutalibacteraceae bacterium]|nr:hypothetical protein [Acutalibacteraceae bacterium]